MRPVFSCFVLSALLGATGAAPQQGPPTLEFSFSNPGARSMGFGGAFVALADDATAAYANPAGLVQLARPEISIEGRLWSYDTPFTAGGRTVGTVTGIGLDTESGLRTGISSDELTGISFLSFVQTGKDWSLAFYRHKAANFEASTLTEGLFTLDEDGDGLARTDLRSQTRIDLVTHGVAFAYRLTPRFSVGVTLSLVSVEIFSENEEFEPAAFFGPGRFTLEGLDTAVVFSVDDVDIAMAGGFLWQLSPRLTVGGFLRQGPEADLRVDGFAGPESDFGFSERTRFFTATDPIRLPHAYGLGLAYRFPNEALTVSFEWDRIEYSSILASIDVENLGDETITIHDGDELHLGFEYVFVDRTPILALRFGAWLDPDHSLTTSSGASADEQAVFRAGDDEVHFAAGLGFAFRDFQIDVGVDFSDRRDTVSVSAIYRF